MRIVKTWSEEIFDKFHGDVFLLLTVSAKTKIDPRLQKLLNDLHFRWKSTGHNLFENLKPFRPDLAELKGQIDSKFTENSTKSMQSALWRSPTASKKFLFLVTFIFSATLKLYVWLGFFSNVGSIAPCFPKLRRN